MTFPSLLLKKLYTTGSLENTGAGARFALKNRLSDAEVVGVGCVAIDGAQIALDGIRLLFDGQAVTPGQVDAAHPLPFPLRSVVTVQTDAPALRKGMHEIEIEFETRPFGKLHIKVEGDCRETDWRAADSA